jgi:peptidyl-prolyl cis-trans isomerase D
MNKSEFQQEKKVKARHILIAFQGARNASGEAAKRSKADAKALADKVQAEAKKSSDFAALATKYTDEASGKTKGGDLGYFKKDQMVKEFADVAFALKPGEISNVVESPFGFHIIKVDSIQDAKSVSLDDAKREIAEKLIAHDRRPQIMDQKVKELFAAVKDGKGEDQLKALGLSWKSTGPFSVGARFIPGLGADKAVLQAVSSLHKVGEIAPNPLDVNGAKFIIRLKSRQEADLSKLTAEKRKQLSDSSRYMDSYMLYTALAEDVRKRYEAKGKIYRNPEFVNYDQLNRRASTEAE